MKKPLIKDYQKGSLLTELMNAQEGTKWVIVDWKGYAKALASYINWLEKKSKPQSK